MLVRMISTTRRMKPYVPRILSLYSLKTYFSFYKEPDHLQIIGCEQAVSKYVPVELFYASSRVKGLSQSLTNTAVDHNRRYVGLPCCTAGETDSTVILHKRDEIFTRICSLKKFP